MIRTAFHFPEVGQKKSCTQVGLACNAPGMIVLHRLKGEPFYLNHRHIEIVESNPDTTITLTNERKYVVRETPEEIAALITAYHQKILPFQLSEMADL